MMTEAESFQIVLLFLYKGSKEVEIAFKKKYAKLGGKSPDGLNL